MPRPTTTATGSRPQEGQGGDSLDVHQATPNGVSPTDEATTGTSLPDEVAATGAVLRVVQVDTATTVAEVLGMGMTRPRTPSRCNSRLPSIWISFLNARALSSCP